MRWRVCADAEEFLRIRGDVLRSNESLHCLALAACARFESRPGEPPSHTFLVLEGDPSTWSYAIVGSDSQTAVLSRMDEEPARALARRLDAMSLELEIAEGPEHPALAFSRLWSEVRGVPFERTMDTGLYEVTRVVLHDADGGCMVPAAQENETLLRDFLAGFHHDCFPNDPFPVEKIHKRVKRLIDERKGALWRTRDGELVAMAAVVRESLNAASISLVYTPREHRRRGYAARLVGELSQAQLRSGKAACNLHADMKNATAHGVYTRLGYVKIAQSIRVAL